MVIVTMNRTNSLSPGARLTDQLRENSRLRRERQDRLAKASTRSSRRNDMLPRLPTFGRRRESSASSIPLMFGRLLLRSPPLDFASLSLSVAITSSSMAKSATRPPSNGALIPLSTATGPRATATTASSFHHHTYKICYYCSVGALFNRRLPDNNRLPKAPPAPFALLDGACIAA
jgi:hypothetical protein